MIKENPIITISLCSYNHALYLKQCIDSLVNQTYPYLDIHITDDCSTDGSREILESYGDKIRVTYRDKNLGFHPGVDKAINEDIKTGKGDFFFRTDSDDFFELDYFEKLIEVWKEDKQLDWIVGALNVVDKDGKVLTTWRYTDWSNDPKIALMKGWNSCSVVMPTHGIIKMDFLRRNKLEYRNFDFGWGNDTVFSIEAMLCKPKIKFVRDAIGTNWRTHGGNTSFNVENRVKIIPAVKNLYMEKVPQEYWLPEFDDSVMEQMEKDEANDYLARKYFAIAKSFYDARANFKIPTIFQNENTSKNVRRYIWNIDTEIRKYTNLCLKYSDKYQHNIDKIFSMLNVLDNGRDIYPAHLTVCNYMGNAQRYVKANAQDRNQLVNSLNWLMEYIPKQDSPEIMEIYKKNIDLRLAVLEKFDSSQIDLNERIILHQPGNGAIKYLMKNWKMIFDVMGVSCYLMKFNETPIKVFEFFKPTSFITVADPYYINNINEEFLKKYKEEHDITIGNLVDHKTFSKAIDCVDFLITSHLNPHTDKKYKNVDKPIMSIPFGANPLHNYMRLGLPIWPYVFVGTNSNVKANETKDYLTPIVEKYPGLVIGTNFDFGIPEIDPEQISIFYNCAAICPNFHIKMQYEESIELNERTYVLPACGAFQIVDRPTAMNLEFNNDELCIVDNVKEYHSKFEYYLKNPIEKLSYISKGMEKVMKNYTLFHRLKPLCDYYRSKNEI